MWKRGRRGEILLLLLPPTHLQQARDQRSLCVPASSYSPDEGVRMTNGLVELMVTRITNNLHVHMASGHPFMLTTKPRATSNTCWLAGSLGM
ncbi:hypothetical protein IWX92DRAFT_361340 [Phyllosticta citricarpa]